MLHEKLATPDGEAEYAIVAFNGTRLFLTPKPIFEDKLEAPPPYGLTHAVFEVDASRARGGAASSALGAQVLIPPTRSAPGSARGGSPSSARPAGSSSR